ncbi:hypothetical protein KOY_04523 [Bacillus cereus VDM021]|uniref:hypothetical protein n=1 Tax=Bacillus pseudomycoides TaxID=64104 RepID=UPI00032E2D02|nr:hypothetical protein [Bacillus pseudomycoides]EOQ05391.1 hypothetical protein KOY_04523 [Bacillus cereus VDM021]PEK62655.1 hypothetical protein CN590_21315 [Bacillus pseudomycoides]PGE88228.1 hypothetical protein COM55_03075 [Bacillus pseudomycoides]
MSRKGWIISAVVGLFIAIAIGSTFVFSSGKGEVMELSPLEMKKFMSEDGTGFVMLNSNRWHSDDWIYLVKKLAEQEKIEVRGLNENRKDVPGTSNPYDWGLSQRRDSLAYYEKGKLKKDIDFSKYKKSDVDLEKAVSNFIQSCKERYQK